MFDPISTYRIQFHKDFTFENFQQIIPYLQELGVKTIYASPVYEAVPGSMHGYDVVNPGRINPEIGTIEQLRDISAKLKSAGIFWIQDIVPNHMGFDQHNAWLMDVLKHGEASIYRSYFDLVTADLNEEPLMVPFLGDDLDTVIENGELELVSIKGEQYLKYFESHWPVRVDITDDVMAEQHKIAKNDKKTRVSMVAKQQYYRLCNSKETNERINYRRFFTVNSLICLNIQYAEVFEEYHRFSKYLLDEGIIHGLRIDHVDGLADPTGYLQQLRTLCGEAAYIVVEKILEPGEALLNSWPVQGTTGYDFLGLVNQLHTNKKAEQKFNTFYKDLGQYNKPVQQQILKKKRAFLNSFMQGELENLYQLTFSLSLFEDQQVDKPDMLLLKEVIGEILVRCPVYRFYSSSYPLSAEEKNALELILDDLAEDVRYARPVDIIRQVLLEGNGISPDYKERAAVFYRRLMQFSGPLMAKGVEDTLMYTYNRFIGNNEVGDSPEVFGISIADFHEQILTRQRYWPQTMNTTATHDTKRGEDARARLVVLTDLRKEWIAEVNNWQELNQDLKLNGKPDANDEYFIYQTLIATYPEENAGSENYTERLLEYIEKALRESRRKSEWEKPDLEYELAAKNFITGLLDQKREFWKRFISFFQKVAAYGRMTSLSTLLLKHLLPGVPDTYQGTEFWELSMVDPDNRRPVDYLLRAETLSKFRETEFKLKTLWQHGADGQVKLYLLQKLLRLRQDYASLFVNGLYIPLTVTGKYAANVLAFARRYKGDWLLCAVPVNLAAVNSAPGAADWEDTSIIMPEGIPDKYLNILDSNDAAVNCTEELRVSELFADFPLGVLVFQKKEHQRGVGILLHVTSLPSAYGIGDFGPVALKYLSFLSDNGLKYWQVLPMNPISGGHAYSPYSTTSVMAGNTLLISPEILYDEGLLTKEELDGHQEKIKRNVSYKRVTELKNKLFQKAYQSWLSGSGQAGPDFLEFCSREANWLDDYALFEVIRTLHNHKPWFEWAEKLRDRDLRSLETLGESHSQRITEIKWQQFVFFEQWAKLKKYAQALGISMIGDVPFYTALDSADVWVNRELFAIMADGKAKGIAGVPPDYFNEEGQLWGMPVYDWKNMSLNNYKWWADRLAKNLELYDLVRLDHFRAFSAYWVVPSTSQSAREGVWKLGPGAAFFKAMLLQLGRLPFIAEDLGEISEDVYHLRDQFALPGMKVLQFAFSEDSAGSVHIPHNYMSSNCVVYTGTHDNNTSLGWYKEEADNATKKRMESYTGIRLSRKNAVQQMIRLALSSTAEIAIIPMQDILNKPAKDRMNTPAYTDKNWIWRLKPKELSSVVLDVLRDYMRLYKR
ncbi:malto-oligosyltrehalose synthase/4-alpha-glucanotransferase [Pedobacter cryoconitis]|uniref:malto-oligosyltrehalose synthase n=1 Tax=Pedobacter cryoconitis TaxID=188932 RepID=UPI001609D695|nr:malto-oligosyltrehalose synthase [Pedobacter cryoconitis]MBB6272460.1 malto-oligosyltrehalose synthase/4-alpha-glucanotransferase [Pedobacter cryoconitis]